MTELRKRLYNEAAESYRGLIRKGVSKGLALNLVSREFFISVGSLRANVDLKTINKEFAADLLK